MSENTGLSKSKYLSGIACPKILWMDENMPDLAENTASDATLRNGKQVGEVARNYFGEHTLVEFSYDKKIMCAQTVSLMESGADNIAEASILYDGLYCAVDILHKDEDGWDIVEVKSATEIKPEYLDDMAFQLYVLEKSGLKINKVYNMHVDNTYVRQGELDLQALFALEDCTGEVRLRKYDVEGNVRMIRQYLEQTAEPEQIVGLCCLPSEGCPYRQYCMAGVPTPSVFDIRRLDKKRMVELYNDGIVTFDDVLNHQVKLSAKQMLQVETAAEHLPDTIDENAIIEFLNTLRYPLYHLDFETFQQAIPEFDGQKPYDQLPFQYSLHIEYADGRLEHKEFLAKEGTDPRRAIAESLCNDIPLGVCSLAYNMSFEKTRLKELAALFPDLSDNLLDISDNMHDLMVPFQKCHYYKESMQGSYSIKYVLPSLYPNDPELDYHSLEGIHRGDEASEAFATLAFHSPAEIEEIRRNLLKYCGLDTYAMVKVLAKLREVVGA